MDHQIYLTKKHRELDEQIRQMENSKPLFHSPDYDKTLAELKRTKLKIKDELAGHKH
jgi:uncharacterized protein YdcH (DUF465 family)